MTDPNPRHRLWEFRSAALFTPTTIALGWMLLALAVVRVALLGFARTDLIAILLFLAAYPFAEWTAHRFVLHSGEFEMFGSRRQLGISRNHLQHHLNPSDMSKVASETGRNLVVAIFGAALPFLVIFRALRPTLTGAALVVVGLLAYELTHGLIHCGYAGRSGWYRRVRRLHLLHHFRNEDRWFGVASTFADTVLRTNPAPASVPISRVAESASPTAAATATETATGESATPEA